MHRIIARLPESVTELCLVRLGIQARGLSAWLSLRRWQRAIDGESAAAIAAGAGLLHSERFSLGRGHFGVLQYWRSFAELDAWSRRPPHSEWWRAAVARMRTRGDLGVYHETFLVPRARVESIYVNCRPAGLAAFGTTAEPVGPDTNSRGRLGIGPGLPR
jgi:hypothetical protein